MARGYNGLGRKQGAGRALFVCAHEVPTDSSVCGTPLHEHTPQPRQRAIGACGGGSCATTGLIVETL